MIKRSSPEGPIIFKQERCGKNGKPFVMYKFRTMVPDAEQRLESLIDKNEASGPVFKISDDPRVFKYASALRKTSIDEIPQFVNILPLRIIKTGQGIDCDFAGLFVLPAYETRAQKALFPQVKAASGACLRAVRKSFKNFIRSTTQLQRIFAKRLETLDSGALRHLMEGILTPVKLTFGRTRRGGFFSRC